MTQITTSLYETLANFYAAIDVDLTDVEIQSRAAVDAIVDITTGYGDPSSDADAALELELALLTPFNSGYVTSKSLSKSTGSLLDAVRALNNFVINNTTGTDTATVKLNTWINTAMSWTSVPPGWKNISEDAGYTVTAWV